MRKEARQIRFNLTPAMRRAMRAVSDGNVSRTYLPLTGDVVNCTVKGISPRIFWTLINMRMIEDGNRGGDTAILKLTHVGQLALKSR